MNGDDHKVGEGVRCKEDSLLILTDSISTPIYKHYFKLKDWEPNHAHWRGPSWFGVKFDGSIEMGAAYLANMRRNWGPIDNGELMSFGVKWEMFDLSGKKIWYGGVFLVWDLPYKDKVENIARQWPGSLKYQDYAMRSSKCVIKRFISTHMSPEAPTVPVVTIPWNP